MSRIYFQIIESIDSFYDLFAKWGFDSKSGPWIQLLDSIWFYMNQAVESKDKIYYQTLIWR